MGARPRATTGALRRVQSRLRRRVPLLALGCLLGAAAATLSFPVRPAGSAARGSAFVADGAVGAASAAEEAPGLRRRDSLVASWAGAWAGLQAQAPAWSAGEPWREDVPKALKALQGFQVQWANLSFPGEEFKGAGKIRNVLFTKYDEPLNITVPAGQEVGAKVSDRGNVVLSVEGKAGWKEGDIIVGVNGKEVRGPIMLRKFVEEGKADGVPLLFTIERSGTPFQDLERKLRDAYKVLEDPDLPELEETQVRLGNAKALCTAGAGARTSAETTMKDLRKEIDYLVTALAPVVKAIS